MPGRGHHGGPRTGGGRRLSVRPRIGSSGLALRPTPQRSAGELLRRVGELCKCLEKATQSDRLDPSGQRSRLRRLLPARQNSVESPSQVLAERGRPDLPDRVRLVHVVGSSNERPRKAREVAGANHDDGRVIVCLGGLLEQLRARADRATRRRFGKSPTMLPGAGAISRLMAGSNVQQ
jgi:hypothetical protein